MEEHVTPPRSELTVMISTPTGGPAPGPVEDGAVCRRQADGVDVICEIDGGGQLQEADVVLRGVHVVRRVAHRQRDAP